MDGRSQLPFFIIFDNASCWTLNLSAILFDVQRIWFSTYNLVPLKEYSIRSRLFSKMATISLPTITQCHFSEVTSADSEKVKQEKWMLDRI